MLLKGPLADFGDLGVIDLDFVRRVRRSRRKRQMRCDGDKEEAAKTPAHLSSGHADSEIAAIDQVLPTRSYQS